MTDNPNSQPITETHELNSHTFAPSQQIFDVLVVGAGVVGCAVTRRLALENRKVILVEKSGDILDGASKGNSAILHTGFDAPISSVEQACIADGYQEFRDIHSKFNLPLLETGAIVLAWDDEQASSIDAIMSKAHANGVSDVVEIDVDAARSRVPLLAPGVKRTLYIPGECVVDPWSTPLAYLYQALAHGATFVNNCQVHQGNFNGGRWHVSTSRGELQAHWLVNCAGLYGDLLHNQLIGEPLFQIRPRKGQFLVYDKSAKSLSDTVLLPVPTEKTKGIVVCPTIFGNLLVGPSADDQESRDDTGVDTETLDRLKTVGESILPDLKHHSVTGIYAGIRPATESSDYEIQLIGERQYLCVGGIRSTGLSAALGIARLASRTMFGNQSSLHETAGIQWPTVPQISESGERDWMRPDNGGIVCHCELVTRREIENALQGPLPVQSLSGLKRRTRVTMGRCQGFYCSAELSEITAGYFDSPLDVLDQ